MSRPTRSVLLIVAGAVTVGAMIAVFLLTRGPTELTPDQAAGRARSAGEELSSATRAVDISVSVAVAGGERQEFSGEGTVDFGADRAGITYDFSALLNAGGGFGHLEEFGAVFEPDLIYLQIFAQGQTWVSLTPSQVADRDIERLRELILTSPSVLPDYLLGLTNVTGVVDSGTTTLEGVLDPADLESSSEIESQIIGALRDLEVEEISVMIEIIEEDLRLIEYEVKLPIQGAEGLATTVTVRARLDAATGRQIEAPPASDVRDIASYLD